MFCPPSSPYKGAEAWGDGEGGVKVVPVAGFAFGWPAAVLWLAAGRCLACGAAVLAGVHLTSRRLDASLEYRPHRLSRGKIGTPIAPCMSDGWRSLIGSCLL